MSESQVAAAPPDSGRLADRPLPTLLLDLHRERFDGQLVVTSGRHERRFELDRGAPVFVESNIPSESLCAQLVARGAIDSETERRVRETVQRKRCREGVALLSLRVLPPRDLIFALKDQIRRRLVDSFAWTEGDWRIEPGEPRGAETRALRCDPLPLVQEGLATHWRIERMLEGLAHAIDRYPTPRKSFAKLVQRLKLGGDQAAAVAAIDGRRPFGVALGPVLGVPGTVAAVWILDAVQAFEYADAAAVDEAEALAAFDSEIEIDVDGPVHADEKRTPRTAPRAAAAGSRPSPQQAGGDEAARLRSQIETLRASLGELTHYQVLGLEPDVRAGAIKKAYIQAAKQYHPDTLARLGLEDLRQDASDVFARVAEAFEILTDAARRADYDAELRGELTEKDAMRLAQAEASYRKGEILLRMGDFAGAVGYLAPAVEIWPDEPVYQSALGWALFKQPKSDPAAARAHLELAVRQGPDDATAHMRLGMVLRALGENEAAEKVTAIGRRLQPSAS
jgi:tetratricopeptide (TPR) repeat protein